MEKNVEAQVRRLEYNIGRHEHLLKMWEKDAAKALENSNIKAYGAAKESVGVFRERVKRDTEELRAIRNLYGV